MTRKIKNFSWKGLKNKCFH